MSRSTFIVVIKPWNEIMCTMSRTTDWATFLQDFSTASKVRCLYYSGESYAFEWELPTSIVVIGFLVKWILNWNRCLTERAQTRDSFGRTNDAGIVFDKRNVRVFKWIFKKYILCHYFVCVHLFLLVPSPIAKRLIISSRAKCVLSELQNRMPHTSF